MYVDSICWVFFFYVSLNVAAFHATCLWLVFGHKNLSVGTLPVSEWYDMTRTCPQTCRCTSYQCRHRLIWSSHLFETSPQSVAVDIACTMLRLTCVWLCCVCYSPEERTGGPCTWTTPGSHDQPHHRGTAPLPLPHPPTSLHPPTPHTQSASPQASKPLLCPSSPGLFGKSPGSVMTLSALKTYICSETHSNQAATAPGDRTLPKNEKPECVPLKISASDWWLM